MEIVCFDSSVLFKANVTRFLLGAAQVGEYRAVWSAAVVEEARRNLRAKGRMAALTALEQNLQLVRDAEVGAASPAGESMLTATDPKDRHVLAAAASAGASMLVTANAKDFDPSEAASLGIEILTPDEFAMCLASRNPWSLAHHVERVPRERLSKYIDGLRQELPTTIGNLEPLLRTM